MRVFFAAGCVIAGVLAATSAFADSAVVATLQQPVAKPFKFVASQVLWECDGSKCVSSTAHDMYFGASECHEVARHAGIIASFKNDDLTLAQVSLDRCNAGVQPKTPPH
jgi:hypothetical protein